MDIFIKIYFYLNQGVNILNNFRNLFLAIFGVYFTLKLDNPLLLVVMFIVAVPTLVVIGYINIHKIAKKSDELNTKYGTFYTIKQYQLIEEIRDLIKSRK